MKRKSLVFILVVLMLTLLLTSCNITGDKKVSDISIKDGTFKYTYEVGETVDLSDIILVISYNDGTSKEVGYSDATVDTFSTSTAGTKKLTITYEGFTKTIDVRVESTLNGGETGGENGGGSNSGVDYSIVGVTEPASISSLVNKKKDFINGSYGYVVGDDNAYYYTLSLSVYDADDNKVTITTYTSFSLVYLVTNENDSVSETLLEGEELERYVSIDETKNAFDFTEAAIGKTFKIASRPAEGLLPEEYDDFTRTHTVTIVDGYNIYSAKELNIITNATNDKFDVDGDGVDETTQADVAKKFLQDNGIAIPDSPIASVILHGDLTVTVDDLPSVYMVNTTNTSGEEVTYVHDVISIYYHTTNYQNAEGKYEFTIHGNYYTIFSNGIPYVNPAEAADDGNVTHTQLFKFNVDTAALGYDYRNYSLNINNLKLMDDNPNDPEDNASARSMLGLIAMKVSHQNVTVDNTIMERYTISFFGDCDRLAIDLNEVKLYNAWQNHIYLWSNNDIDEKDTVVSADDETYSNIKLNVTKSIVTTCGGPVIISQVKDPSYTKNQLSGPDVIIDEETSIYSYSTPDSIWFTSLGANSIATQIVALDGLFTPGYTSFMTTNPLDGVYNGNFMNIIMVNLKSGYDLTNLGNDDLDGTFSVGDNTLLNMNDGENAAVEQIIALSSGAAPVFQSAAGITSGTGLGVGYFDGSTMVTGLTGDPATDGYNQQLLYNAEGGYLMLYFNGMGIVLGDYHSIVE